MLMHKLELKKLWDKAVKEEGVTNGEMVILKGGKHTNKFREELMKHLQKSINEMDNDVIDMMKR